MEELHKKILDLERENIDLKEKLSASQRARAPLGTLQEITGKSKITTSDAPSKFTEHPELKCTGSLEQTLNYLKTILGYNIDQIDNRFILRSVYAFCEEDVFEIEISNNRLIFKNTEYLSEHQDAFNTYVRNGKSYCAFFAAVTIDLFNKKTFG